MRHRIFIESISGNADSLRLDADSLKQMEDVFLQIVSKKTGESENSILSEMKLGNVYFYGKNAVEKNQVDEVVTVSCGKDVDKEACPLNKDIFRK